MDQASSARVPWHFWPVAVLSLLWNAYGGYDYTMTKLRDPGYLKMFPPEMMDWIDKMPVWATAMWAIGVWASLLGSILLLMRSRHAAITLSCLTDRRSDQFCLPAYDFAAALAQYRQQLDHDRGHT